jgi:hypothetical protein
MLNLLLSSVEPEGSVADSSGVAFESSGVAFESSGVAFESSGVVSESLVEFGSISESIIALFPEGFVLFVFFPLSLFEFTTFY